MEDIPVRNIGDNKETPLTGEMGLINRRDEELWLTEDLLQEDPIKPMWIQKRSCHQLTCVEGNYYVLERGFKVSIWPTGLLLFWYLYNVKKGILRKKLDSDILTP